jgi:hypothetical protein
VKICSVTPEYLILVGQSELWDRLRLARIYRLAQIPASNPSANNGEMS